MWCHKPILVSLASLFGLQLLAQPASTNALPELARPAPTILNATVQNGEIVGNEQRRRVFMKVESRRLMLVVPQDFRAVNASPEKVVLANRNYSCVLSFRIASPGRLAAAALSADLCRAWLSAELDDLNIQEEFSLTAANQSGPAFEVQYKAEGLSRSSQVAFIPSPLGVLEFSLASNPEAFQAAKSDFRRFLRGFRISGTDGKLEILPPQSGS